MKFVGLRSKYLNPSEKEEIVDVLCRRDPVGRDTKAEE